MFVFFIEGDDKSVVREWGYLVESVKEKCDCSVILRHKAVDLGSLIRGDIEEKRILEYSFENDEELLNRAFAGCFSKVYNLI